MSIVNGTLHTSPEHGLSIPIRAAAAYGGLDLNFAQGFVAYQTNKTPEFLAKFPQGKVPAFEGPNGFYLTETIAIARYVSSFAKNVNLLGSTPEQAAHVDQWLFFGATEINPPMSRVVGPLNGTVPYFKPIDVSVREQLSKSLAYVNNHLQTRTFLVTDRITLADIVLTTILRRYFVRLTGEAERAKIPNVVRFVETVANHPKLKPIFGEVTYPEKAEQYVPPAKEAKPKAPAAAAAAAAPKPKAPKPADDDEDEPLVPAEPKAKNPLDDLPKSNFNLEDWKRAYSNMDTRGSGGSIEWFYDKFDHEGFSVWKVQFKYNEELTQVFMSSNQIGGFFNRLEASRKYLFGSVGVLGAANDSVIAGVLILRGQDVKPVVDVAPDWESYEYKKLDLSNPEDKSYFEAALAWDLEVGGKKWADGKNFK
ncbi:hypothetical protein BOTBODRAFT_59000 [Botryobasidium botryosum FD-172 SS1]|uniref:Elongation factor 1-gamma n=1 Tax=Botryobasidium botryosum (strain FD-172 SS1) TaxID=930990 RepID=A0A067M2M0_BOTB1|nr:hypothetical protein BOTBODRAFT_59000 [Botryobasidium botryosum FD-172 SS1]